MLNRLLLRSGWIAVLLGLTLAGCQTPGAKPDATPTPDVPLPTLTPTETPRALVICLGQEPTTLYAYGGASRAMWSVLEAIYDGPFDTRQYAAQPVILEKMPNLTDGDALLSPVTVSSGDEVIDAHGELVTLTAGVKVFPAGCSDPGCILTWDGSAPLQMDQLSVTFKLLPGITWSDGEPLTAADSVYSYQLTTDPATPVSRYNVYRTQAYQAADATTVHWVGKPGFLPERYDTLFWLPLPQHKWQTLTPSQLLDAEESSQRPLGWGAYTIQKWVKGDHIEMRRNPNYFRAAQGLPRFETLIFRFLGEPADNNLAALQIGECDVVDQTSLLEAQLEPILELERDGKLKAFIGQGPEWEIIDFGIRPAAYDNGYSVYSGDRPDFFGDVRVRQAFAYCIDRQWIIDRKMYGQSSIPVGLWAPSHPLYLENLSPLPFDPVAGSRLLDETGWRDLDGNPHTPRQASGVPGVFDGTPLAITYATTQAPLRTAIAERLTQSLAECGIQVTVKYYTPAELFAPGPEGILFGRNFDLVQWGRQTSNCALYSSMQIPNPANHWLGFNVSGYSSPEFDEACQAAVWTRPEQPDYKARSEDVQRRFASELPSVPLYFRIKMAVSRPDLCGLEMDVTARSALWNLEQIDYGAACPK
ncbi:MAG: ABC transporter substrate-binding protein [Anaerolineaceae bacterium]|nr:ABC transporter substrate-binding protein [Anaerolineaceae bacterium]